MYHGFRNRKGVLVAVWSGTRFIVLKFWKIFFEGRAVCLMVPAPSPQANRSRASGAVMGLRLGVALGSGCRLGTRAECTARRPARRTLVGPEVRLREVRPFGSWGASLSAQDLVAGSLRLGEVRIARGRIHWIEGRPTDGRLITTRASENSLIFIEQHNSTASARQSFSYLCLSRPRRRQGSVGLSRWRPRPRAVAGAHRVYLRRRQIRAADDGGTARAPRRDPGNVRRRGEDGRSTGGR